MRCRSCTGLGQAEVGRRLAEQFFVDDVQLLDETEGLQNLNETI